MTTNFEEAKKSFIEFWNDNNSLHEQAKNTFLNMIKAFLDDEHIVIASITGRVKDRDECIKKFERKYRTSLEEEGKEYKIQDEITDLIGVRIVCLYEVDIDSIYKVLAKEFNVIESTNKTEELNKKGVFGYKGLHLDLKLNDSRTSLCEYKRLYNIRFEVQVRTIIQDAWSVLDHKIKYKKSIPEAMKRKINALAALFEIADNEFFHINEQAKKQEEEARTKQIYSEELKLNVFNFSAIWEKYFSESQIQPVDFKVDNFVHEITEINDTLTANKLSELISEHLETIDSFSEYLFAKKVISLPMNPYTKIRHVLYMSDRECYKNILYILQKKKFDDWLDGKRDNNES